MQADDVEIDRGVGARYDAAAGADGLAHGRHLPCQGLQLGPPILIGQRREPRPQPGVFPGRIERADSVIVDQRAVVGEHRLGQEKGRGARRPAGDEGGGDVLIDRAQGADGPRIAGPAGRAHVLHAVDAEPQGRIMIMRCHRQAAGMGPGRHLLLPLGRQAHIGLDQVIGQRLGATQLQVHLAGLGHRPHEIVIDARPVDRLAGGVVARAKARAGLDRLLVLDGVIGRTARRAGGGHAHRQPKPPFPIAIAVALHLAVRVHVDQARHDRRVGGVDPARRPRVRPRAARDKGGDPGALDDDVQIAAQLAVRSVPKPAGLDHQAAFGLGAGPGQTVGNGARRAARGLDQPQLAGRQIEDPRGIAAPGRRVGHLVIERDRLAGQRPAAVNGRDP